MQAENVVNLLACDNEPEYLAKEIDRLLHSPHSQTNLRKFNGSVDTTGASQVISSQQLFSVYTHPSREYQFPETSIFYGTEVPDRSDTNRAWAKFSLVAAEIKLLTVALEEKRNQ